MKRPLKLFLILGGSLAMALAGSWAGLTLVARGQSPETDIASPETWVPFAAATLHEAPGRAGGVAGRFFRGSDGSSRSETWSIDAPSKSVIEIQNVSESAYYVKILDRQWRKHPMKLPATGYHPLRMRLGTRGLQPSPITVENMQAYRLVGSRLVEFRAPQLNFFPILVVDPVSGFRNRYFDIAVGEQEPGLFRPPTGVTVENRPELMGIVVDDRDKPQSPATKASSCGQPQSANGK